MIIPEKTIIHGRTFDTIFDNKRLELLSLSGQISYNEQKIRLRDDVHKELTEETYLHEVLHGILTQLGYENYDEQFICGVSSSLHQVIKQIIGKQSS